MTDDLPAGCMTQETPFLFENFHPISILVQNPRILRSVQP